MAIRVRKDGTMWCAAHTHPLEGDTYIDDREHYFLSVGKVLLVKIHTSRSGTAKRYIKVPPILSDVGIDYEAFMKRAEREAQHIGVVRSIELVDAEEGQKLINWDGKT